MSNPQTDYSNTIIYKIYCKDERIQDVYVGHTTNFVKRKKSHMSSCMKSNYPNHNCKLYQVIRQNGGWDNWQMMIIAFYECNDLDEARQKEQYHYVELKATLNSVEPLSNGLPYHQNEIKVPEPITPNKIYNSMTYKCDNCNFNTNNKKDYNRHLSSKKHQKCHPKTNVSHDNCVAINPITPPLYSCQYCNRSFKSRTTIYQHKAKCRLRTQQKQDLNENTENTELNYLADTKVIDDNTSNKYDGIMCVDGTIALTKDMFMAILNDRQEMLKIIKSLSEQQNINTTNNTTTNTKTIPTISESNSFVTNQNYITEVITHNQELTASNQELRTAMLLLIQQNTDFQNKMLDICKKSSHS